MKIVKYILLVSTIVVSCSVPVDDVIGKYQAHEYNVLEKGIAFITGKRLSTGSSLDLRPDSTYTFLTCANIITGKWDRNEDQLYLHAGTHRFRKESDKLPSDSLKVSTKPIIFNIIKSVSREKTRLSHKHGRLKIDLVKIAI